MTTHECGCCESCRASLPDHWVSDLWRYCPHTRVMSKRKGRDQPWTLVANVPPKRALKHITAATQLMRKHARKKGWNWEGVNQLLNWYRTEDPAAK